jgi:DNA-binding transcriptional ArsR family regulator
MKPTKNLAANAAHAADMLKHLAHEGRLALLCALVDGEKPAAQLVDASGLSQSAASQHLAKLRLAGLVVARREGQSVVYRLASGEARALLTALHRIFCKE